MLRFVRLVYYISKSIGINLTRNNVRVTLSSQISKGSVLKGFNRVGKHSYFHGVLGEYSYIGENCDINAIVGKFCSIGTNVKVVSGTHPTSFVSSSPVFYSTQKQCGTSFVTGQKFIEKAPFLAEGIEYRVLIGNDVWIGDNVLIKNGIKIGDGAVIGMGAVVTKDVSDYSIVAGNPARIIRYRFDLDIVDILKRSQWWDWNSEKLKKFAECMDDPVRFIATIEKDDTYL